MEERDTSGDDFADSPTRTRGMGQPQQPPAGPKKKFTLKGCGCLGGVVLLVIIIAAIADSAGKSGTDTAGSSQTVTGKSVPADGGSYASVDTLLDALSGAGLPCSGATEITGSTIAGSLGADDCNSPGATGGTTDSVVSVFDSHADAQAYAQNMLSFGEVLAGSSTQEVVGVNWVVNTVPPYGSSVAAKLGGQVETVMGSAPATTAAPASKVVLSKSGSGIAGTRSFTVGDDWALQYSFNCSNFGGQGNFQVFEDFPGGDVLVNALAKKGSDTTYQSGDAGTHTLKVNSECDWTIKVIDNDPGQ